MVAKQVPPRYAKYTYLSSRASTEIRALLGQVDPQTGEVFPDGEEEEYPLDELEVSFSSPFSFFFSFFFFFSFLSFFFVLAAFPLSGCVSGCGSVAGHLPRCALCPSLS